MGRHRVPCGTPFRVRWDWGAFHPGRCPWAKLLWPFRPFPPISTPHFPIDRAPFSAFGSPHSAFCTHPYSNLHSLLPHSALRTHPYFNLHSLLPHSALRTHPYFNLHSLLVHSFLPTVSDQEQWASLRNRTTALDGWRFFHNRTTSLERGRFFHNGPTGRNNLAQGNRPGWVEKTCQQG
jgi:hypothetical protein